MSGFVPDEIAVLSSIVCIAGMHPLCIYMFSCIYCYIALPLNVMCVCVRVHLGKHYFLPVDRFFFETGSSAYLSG